MAATKKHKINDNADLSLRTRYENWLSLSIRMSIGMDPGSAKASP